MKNTNIIHPTAKIHKNIILGHHNRIGKNVILECKNSVAKVTIGDNNIINDNTRIFVDGDLSIGDWNTFHNDMLVMSGESLNIGHNCWFGQNTILDGSGGLEIGNGVRVGMYSQIWTHVASGELIEGCTLYGKRKTILKDDVWLVGSCIVSSGVTVGERTTCLIGSNITKDTNPGLVYAGSPAKVKDKLSFYKDITLLEKFKMMLGWVDEFVNLNKDIMYSNTDEEIKIWNNAGEKILIIIRELEKRSNNTSVFSLKTKKYIKTQTDLERLFYSYIYGNKARFIPYQE